MCPKISAVIITKNETQKIEACLQSLNFVDEIVIVDSESTDKTLQICKRYGAKVFTHQFQGYGEQRNWALTKTKNTWVFSIDADEQAPQNLQAEIRNLDFSKADGFEIPRLTYFLGKPIKHSGSWWYPGYTLRLFDKSKGRFSDIKVHEKVQVEGKVLKLQNHLLHYSYDNLNVYLQKFNTMTSWQADPTITPWKNSNYLLMFVKPAYRFFQMYFWYQGFLDGFQGFVLAVLSAFYVTVVYFKAWERNTRT